jgi:hypothetical protein
MSFCNMQLFGIEHGGGGHDRDGTPSPPLSLPCTGLELEGGGAGAFREQA